MQIENGLNQCVDRKENGGSCDDNGDCLSLRCEEQVCVNPVGIVEACDEASGCLPLLCNTVAGCITSSTDADTDYAPDDPSHGIAGTTVGQQWWSCRSIR
jgi:hypothetical protein